MSCPLPSPRLRRAGTLWKHTNWRNDKCEVRRARRLSVSFVTTIANYEYAFYWYLYQDGRIESNGASAGAAAPVARVRAHACHTCCSIDSAADRHP